MPSPAVTETYDPISLLEPEFLLPEQNSGEATPRKGEFALLWAVFIDGIRTYCQEVLKDRTTSLAYREVERWIFRPESDVVTSFSSLCQLFEIDSRRLRRRLIQFRDAPDAGLLDELESKAA